MKIKQWILDHATQVRSWIYDAEMDYFISIKKEYGSTGMAMHRTKGIVYVFKVPEGWLDSYKTDIDYRQFNFRKVNDLFNGPFIFFEENEMPDYYDRIAMIERGFNKYAEDLSYPKEKTL